MRSERTLRERNTSDAPAQIPLQLGPLLLGCLILGLAIVPSRGAYSDAAIALVVLSVLLLLWRFGLALAFGQGRPVEARAVGGLLWLGLFANIWTAWNDPAIIIYPHRPWEWNNRFPLGAMVLLLSYVPYMFHRAREPAVVRNVRFCALTGLVLLAGLDALRASPAPYIDVWTVQTAGATSLAAGVNPYSAVAVHDTGPVGASPAVPFVYPPTQLYIAFLGWRLGGDVRYAMLAAILITGILLRYISDRGDSALSPFFRDCPVLYFWLTPKLFFILEQAWIDPVQVMFISAAVAAEVAGRRKLSSLLFGIATSAKQTMFFLLPLAGFVLRWNLRRLVLALSAGFITLVPFLLWDWRALKYANWDFLRSVPARPDSLNLLVWAQHRLDFAVPWGLGFFLAGLVVCLAALRLRGVAHFALASALCYVLFFAFNKFAFANYYYLMASLCALAAATSFHRGWLGHEVAHAPGRAFFSTSRLRASGQREERSGHE